MKWISVKDRLPDEGVRVIVFLDSPGKHECSIDYIIRLSAPHDFGFIWACKLHDEYGYVSHWMPLPERPKE